MKYREQFNMLDKGLRKTKANKFTSMKAVRELFTDADEEITKKDKTIRNLVLFIMAMATMNIFFWGS